MYIQPSRKQKGQNKDGERQGRERRGGMGGETGDRDRGGGGNERKRPNVC